ncbi:STAS domain-containing protein [Streptomyces sp. NPDC001941]|uniref:STAS domain-containing protein n=1 Tax=Streptomyces sp. NPDC001941 TaxID=3154659 RepID=UPI00331C3993
MAPNPLHARDLSYCTLVTMPPEVDLANCLVLYEQAAAIVAARAGGLAVLVLDFTATEFLDTRGTWLLETLLDRIREAGAELRLVAPEGLVNRVLAMTSVRRDVPVYDAVLDAVLGEDPTWQDGPEPDPDPDPS